MAVLPQKMSGMPSGTWNVSVDLMPSVPSSSTFFIQMPQIGRAALAPWPRAVEEKRTLGLSQPTQTPAVMVGV